MTTTALAGPAADLRQLWPHQEQAVQQAVEALRAGNNVIIDAPTGSGKSVIAAHIAHEFGGRSLYLADEVALVRQMASSHPNMYRTIVGHANYCDETWRCDNQQVDCEQCESTVSWYGLHLVTKHGMGYKAAAARARSQQLDCDYRYAKLVAAAHEFVTMSSQYYLTDSMYIELFSGRDLIVLDECDVIQQTADRVFGEDFSYQTLERQARFTERLAGSNSTDQQVLLQRADRLLRLLQSQVTLLMRDEQDEARLDRLQKLAKRVAIGLNLVQTDDVVLTTSNTGFAIRHIDPSPRLARYLWGTDKGGRGVPFVAMSATPGSTATWCRIAGVDPSTVVTIDVPHTFPLENRTVRVGDGPNMSKSAYREDAKIRRMADEILDVAEGPTLVLVNSRAQAQALGDLLGRRFIGHESGQPSKAAAIEQLRARPDGILVSQSFWRGVDLKDDLCRTVIIAKVPWPDWGDPLVRARADRIDGWYAGETALKLVQGCGRAVRGQDDWARIHILDGSYRQAHSRFRPHLPPWFRSALVQ